jgi:hypothetical protein
MKPLKFSFKVKVGDGFVTLMAERICLTDQIQQIRISGKDKHIVIQNDQPLFDKVKMKKVAPWKLVSGKVTNTEAFVETLRQVDHYFRNLRNFE